MPDHVDYASQPTSPRLTESAARVATLRAEAAADIEGFWKREAMSRIAWVKPPTRIKNTSFEGDVSIKWFEDGTLNASVSCLDRHLETRGDQTAIIWEGDEPGSQDSVTYRDLHTRVCKFANALKGLGVRKGDRVTIYMPMVIEAAVAMLASARIGAIHSVVFGGFSPHSLAGRIQDCKSSVVITSDEARRGGKRVPLKANTDEALKTCPDVTAVVVVAVTGATVPMVAGRDHDYATLVADASADCPPEEMGAEDPLFILYTSGSTGTPKGVQHTTGGYMVWASFTHELVFDYRPGEIFWCTADVGWVTGHTYIVYGPLANGATTLMFEGVPTYPDSGRLWEVVDKHKVEIFYTAPTAIRALMRDGDEPVKRSSRTSLRVLGTVGEPINPEAWEWYYSVVGDSRCPIVDTWWQTETGGHLISPVPGMNPLKPGSATLPLPGVKPLIVDSNGTPLEGEADGHLCIADSWPGQMRTVFGDHDRFIKTYFSTYKGLYFTGDGARRDADGYYWITGRVDDVINVSGHRMGTAEVESALGSHHHVAESAVVGYPHDVKGQGIYAYVTLKHGVEATEALLKELAGWVRKEIGPIAVPDVIQWAPGLPKTRSGKIMRRILRKIAANEVDSLGDTSTLADPAVVDDLVSNRKK
ncbi:acetate--CoA ligase [Acidisoma cellulosilytica]|uniref:Acetyl-coenzyme A synthetase n=1 Tax=Acidisoma cellulosilyticum TaxID=2802395 RepID=A0A963Z5T8_9PROT|nr:acetate--CoA ligase [Acidisoma cellulosilyticum]MCB8882387.1 acetate--CoA ligase [Acidisoma cellulosilyticum]